MIIKLIFIRKTLKKNKYTDNKFRYKQTSNKSRTEIVDFKNNYYRN